MEEKGGDGRLWDLSSRIFQMLGYIFHKRRFTRARFAVNPENRTVVSLQPRREFFMA